MVDLRVHDAGDLAVPFGAAPNHAFRPERMLAKLMHRRVIIVLDLVGEREIGRIEDPHFGAKEDEQPGRFLDRETTERPLAQRAVAEASARFRLKRRSEEHTSELQSLMCISYA